MDTANNENTTLETDTSVVEGVESTDADTEGVPEDILASIGEMQQEENPALESHFDGDDPGDTDESVSKAEETDGGQEAEGDRSALMTHLLGKDFDIETLTELTDATLLAVAKSHGWEAQTDDAGDSEEASDESKDEEAEDAAGDLDDGKIVEAIADELGEQFDSDESAAIGKAIAKAVGMIRGAGDSEPLNKQLADHSNALNTLYSYYENMVIDNEIPKLAEIYPGITDEGGRDRLVARAAELTKQGVKVNTPQELLRNAAVIEFGAAAADKHKQFNKKVSRSKVSGQPTGKTGGKDTTNGDDDPGLDIVRNWKRENA